MWADLCAHFNCNSGAIQKPGKGSDDAAVNARTYTCSFMATSCLSRTQWWVVVSGGGW